MEESDEESNMIETTIIETTFSKCNRDQVENREGLEGILELEVDGRKKLVVER